MPTGLKRYDVPGHIHFWTISCYRRLSFFWHDDMKRIVIDALRQLQTRFDICLIGYVIMPEHVHILLNPHAKASDLPVPISKLLQLFKQHSEYHGKQVLMQHLKKHGRLWSKPLTDWANGRYDKQPLWTERAYDFNIDRQDTLIE